VCRDSRDYYGLSAATVRGWTRCAFVKFYFFYFFFSLFYFSFTRGGGGRRRKKPNAALLAQIEFLSYFTRIHTRANHRVPSTCSLTYVHENTYISLVFSFSVRLGSAGRGGEEEEEEKKERKKKKGALTELRAFSEGKKIINNQIV
jgi:hypothetical protein